MKALLPKTLFIFVFTLIFFLQDISSSLLEKRISLFLIKPNAIAQDQQTTIPTIYVDCNQHDSQKVAFSWKAENSEYILIEGYDDKPHPPEGSILGSGTYAFIAVGLHNIVRELKSCYPTEINSSSTDTNNIPWNTAQGNILNRDGFDLDDELLEEDSGSNNASVVAVSSNFDPDVFIGSYKIKIKTSLSPAEIEERVQNLLQNRRFNVDSKIIKKDSQNLEFLFSTTNYNAHEKLCLDQDCNQSIGKRKIERKATFSVWMKKDTIQGNQVFYQVLIKPSVLRNFRRENKNWNLDPDGDRASFELCKELADEIKKNLN